MGEIILFVQLVCGMRFIIPGILFVNGNTFMGKVGVGTRMGYISLIFGKLSYILKSCEKVEFLKIDKKNALLS